MLDAGLRTVRGCEEDISPPSKQHDIDPSWGGSGSRLDSRTTSRPRRSHVSRSFADAGDVTVGIFGDLDSFFAKEEIDEAPSSLVNILECPLRRGRGTDRQPLQKRFIVLLSNRPVRRKAVDRLRRVGGMVTPQIEGALQHL
jgi:hypothetical protein